MTKTIDDLIKESDDALKRIETLQAKKRSSSSKGLIERFVRHTKQHANHLIPMALAGGLVGLSLVRYHEKHMHKDCVANLENRIRVLNGEMENLRDVAATGKKLAQEVHNVLRDGTQSWWKSSPSATERLEKALKMYDGEFQQFQISPGIPDSPEPKDVGEKGPARTALISSSASSSQGKPPRPFI